MHYKKAAAVLGASIFSISVLAACGEPATCVYGPPESISAEESESVEETEPAAESESIESKPGEEVTTSGTEDPGQSVLPDLDFSEPYDPAADELINYYGPPEFFK